MTAWMVTGLLKYELARVGGWVGGWGGGGVRLAVPFRTSVYVYLLNTAPLTPSLPQPVKFQG